MSSFASVTLASVILMVVTALEVNLGVPTAPSFRSITPADSIK